MDAAALLSQKRTNKGRDLAALSYQCPVLVVFLRHSGCTFCRQAVKDVARSKAALEEKGVLIVFVHLDDSASATKLLATHNLHDVETIHDEDQELYRAFGLKRGSLLQVAGPSVLWQGFRAAILDGHGLGRPTGDVLQLPGVFLLDNCEIVRSFRHKTAADRPDYLTIGMPT